jgi:DNA-binding response OmpR family regulator
MMTETLVVADDEAAITDHLQNVLQRRGFHVLLARDGVEALQLTERHRPDLLVLDIRMPSLSGRDVIKRLRAQDDPTPIIVLTVIEDVAETEYCLDIGADDFVHKPYDQGVLLARIRAVLRRARSEPHLRGARLLVAEGLVLDRYAHQAQLDGVRVELGTTALRLLEQLMLNHGQVLDRGMLLDRAWGRSASEYGERVVDRQMTELRAALNDTPSHPGHPRFIETKHGLGYRFRLPVVGQT